MNTEKIISAILELCIFIAGLLTITGFVVIQYQ